MKMISKDRLVGTLIEMKKLTSDKYEAIPKYIDWFIRIVNGEEEVDATPVPHGDWLKINPALKAICSVCGASAIGLHGFDEKLTKYCPNCGAKMDGEDDETN